MAKKRSFGLKKLVSLTLALLFSVFCFGCNNNTNYISARYFNTDVYVQVNGDTLSNDTKSQITSFLSGLEKEFALTDSNSAISRFNKSTTTSVNLSDDGVIILEKAIACYNAFDKKFNPALYPLSVLWQFSPNYPVENFTPPSIEELNSISPLALDFDNVLLDKTQKTLSKLNDSVKIDLGGIAKGYASQKVGEMLKEKGYTSGYVSVGSSSLYILKADSLGIRHPQDKSKLALNVITKNLSDFSVSTSGGYERFYEFDGKNYGHIIDGSTLAPADTNVVSATVILKDGCVSDALSTALCLYSHNPLNPEKSQLVAFIRSLLSKAEYSNAEFYVLFNDGEYKQLITNKNQGENFTLTDINYQVVNV